MYKITLAMIQQRYGTGLKLSGFARPDNVQHMKVIQWKFLIYIFFDEVATVLPSRAPRIFSSVETSEFPQICYWMVFCEVLHVLNVLKLFMKQVDVFSFFLV